MVAVATARPMEPKIQNTTRDPDWGEKSPEERQNATKNPATDGPKAFETLPPTTESPFMVPR
jgi:hypothetical protein